MIRKAEAGDLEPIGRLLDAFNREYDEPTPGPRALRDRMAELIDEGGTVVLVTGGGPDGLAVLRFRSGIWSRCLECEVAELYVLPEHRGRGLGRELVEATVSFAKERGADYVHLATSESDRTARRLYESLGFTNRDGVTGAVMYFYERQL